MASCVKFLVPKSWQRPLVTELEATTSTCATDAVRRKHVFEIKGYRGLLSRTGGAGESVRSAAFAVGGYDWTVLYYPRGCGAQALSGHVSVFVELMTPGAQAWASCELCLVPRSTGARAHKDLVKFLGAAFLVRSLLRFREVLYCSSSSGSCCGSVRAPVAVPVPVPAAAKEKDEPGRAAPWRPRLDRIDKSLL
ncbi:BTB/POZ and MATH domain-containing protein 2-like [Miscanthus floridulus]|uniref:BTB/POZ and MATH domain-containing protein 2-like n=1 Tax=Miscanthus floridulus TaxID=154761 RepID=UPI00345A0504